MAKKEAKKAWSSLSPEDQDAAISAIVKHAEIWKAEGRETQYQPHAASWLRGERFHDELEMPQPKAETGWMKSEQGILSEGKRRGVHPKPGESLWEYRDRVLAA